MTPKTKPTFRLARDGVEITCPCGLSVIVTPREAQEACPRCGRPWR